MRRALSIFFDLLWYISGENLCRIYNDPTRLWEPFKIFKILVKIFRDISFSCQDLQGSSKFLSRSTRIFHFLSKIFKNLSFSCQDPRIVRISKNFKDSLKIFENSLRIFQILVKIFEDLSFSYIYRGTPIYKRARMRAGIWKRTL